MKTTPDASDAREKIFIEGQRLMAARGFSNVGLTELLAEAKVPKGSFYHYFQSKECFGEALLDRYFKAYAAEVDQIMNQPARNMFQRLETYFVGWDGHQSVNDFEGRCLAVKLGSEVADLSESMRKSLKRGTALIIERLARAIEAGSKEGSLSTTMPPALVAENLYSLWLGASVMAKIHKDRTPLVAAMVTTRLMLNPSP